MRYTHCTIDNRCHGGCCKCGLFNVVAVALLFKNINMVAIDNFTKPSFLIGLVCFRVYIITLIRCIQLCLQIILT